MIFSKTLSCPHFWGFLSFFLFLSQDPRPVSLLQNHLPAIPNTTPSSPGGGHKNGAEKVPKGMSWSKPISDTLKPQKGCTKWGPPILFFS